MLKHFILGGVSFDCLLLLFVFVCVLLLLLLSSSITLSLILSFNAYYIISLKLLFLYKEDMSNFHIEMIYIPTVSSVGHAYLFFPT